MADRTDDRIPLQTDQIQCLAVCIKDPVGLCIDKNDTGLCRVQDRAAPLLTLLLCPFRYAGLDNL